MWAIKNCSLIDGVPFEIYSDHQPLKNAVKSGSESVMGAALAEFLEHVHLRNYFQTKEDKFQRERDGSTAAEQHQGRYRGWISTFKPGGCHPYTSLGRAECDQIFIKE